MFVHVSHNMQQKILPDNQCGLDNSNHIIIQEAESQIEQFSSCLLHENSAVLRHHRSGRQNCLLKKLRKFWL